MKELLKMLKWKKYKEFIVKEILQLQNIKKDYTHKQIFKKDKIKNKKLILLGKYIQ